MRFALFVMLCVSAAVRADTLLLDDVRIVDVVRGTVGAPTSVLVEGGRIAAIGDVAANGATRVDCSGRFLIPGLVDSHVHLFNTYSKRPPNDWAFPMFVANGVTAVREMAADVPSVAIAKRWAADATLVAPRILAIGIPLRREPSVERQLDAIAASGAGFAKVFSYARRTDVDRIVAAAKSRGLSVAGHRPGDARVLESTLATNEHLSQWFEACSTREDDGIARRTASGLAEPSGFLATVLRSFDRERCDRVARRVGRSVEVPTLAIYRPPIRAAAPERLALLRVDERERWERALAEDATFDAPERALQWQVAKSIVGALGRAGVTILAGTDTPMPLVFPGWSLHDELAALVESGLTPAQALRSATSEPARVFGDRDAGEVAPGFRADLVLLRANPLADIANTRSIEAVVSNGRYLDRAALDRLLATPATPGVRR